MADRSALPGVLARPVLALSLLLCPCLLTPVAAAAPPETSVTGVISGIVKDSTTGEPIEDAIVVLSCTCLDSSREAMTNARGVYSFGDLPAGNYTVQVLAGKADVSKILQLPRGAKFRGNFSVDPNEERIVEILVEASPVATAAAASMTISMEEAKRLPVGASSSRDFTAVVDIAGTATLYTDDPAPESGVLTAGTLDDNRSDELERFAATAQSPELTREVGLGPRTELFVVDKRGTPILDAELVVSARRSQQRARLRTGTDGRAVINGRLDLGLSPPSDRQLAQVVVKHRGVEVVAQVELGGGPTQIVLPLRQTKAEAQVHALDLVLVVDTTGSMADELEWLSTELRAVVDEVLASHPNVDARLGVVAYRDIGDAYITRRFELSKRHGEFEAFLMAETASGGGDMPEAVDAALAEATNFSWRHDAQAAKVVLLVGDAPPHDERVRETFAAASGLREAGVSIYPVASSGIDDHAELLFRSLAADSGAQYLFLTDDSGIGNPHAKPHAENYDVELLRDALLRILAAELRGEQAALPQAGKRRKAAAFELQRSLLDDAGKRALLGGPRINVGLF